MEMTEGLFKQIIENSLEGVWIIDDKKKCVYVNPSMSRMLGYDLDEIKKTNLSILFKPDDLENLLDKLETRKNGQSEKHEIRVIRKDKVVLWTLASCYPLFNQEEKYIGSVGLLIDISKRKRSETILNAQRKVFEILIRGGSLEHALKELLLPLEELVDGMLGSILLLDKEGKKFSKGAALNLPYAYLEGVLNEPIGPEAGSCGTAAFKKELVIVCDIENDPLWKNYKDLALSFELRACWSSPIFSREGKVLGTFALYFKNIREPTDYELQIVKDVTAAAALSIEHIHMLHQLESLLEKEKKLRQELELLAQARKFLANSLEYEKVLKNIPELIVSHFADWSYITLSGKDGELRALTAATTPECREFLKIIENFKTDLASPHGLPRALREGRSILYSHLTDEDFNTEGEAWPKLGTKDTEFVGVIRKLGLKSYMAIPMIVRGEALGGLIVASSKEGRHYTQSDLALMDEIGRSCAMAIDNTMLYRDAQQSIQNREDFISVASHELRTPLTSLQMRVDLLAHMMDKSEFSDELEAKVKPIVSEIRPDIRKFSQLIETLLDISKLRNNKLHLNLLQMNMSKVVQEEVNRLKHEFDFQQSPLKVYIQEDLFGMCDQVRLQQVVSNLLANALKFGNKKPVEFEMVGNKEHITITVKDNGMGVPSEDKLRIFKPFERAVSDKNFGGLGLGLYISQQIIEGHGGSILVESTLGQGSSFIVELPRR